MASSLRGRLLHLASTRPARTGRAYRQALSALADHGGPTWSVDLEIDLNFILLDLEYDHRRNYPLCPSTKGGPRVWSDASFEPRPMDQGGPKMRLCAIVANDSSRAGVVADVPLEFYSFLEQRETQITMGELLGVCLAFKHFPEALKASSAIVYGDNIPLRWVHCANPPTGLPLRFPENWAAWR